MEMLLEKKANVIFLFKFKMIVKHCEQTTHNINNDFGQEQLKNMQCSGSSRSLQRRRQHWRWEVQWPANRSWQPVESITEADIVTTTWEVAEALTLTIPWSFGMWSKSEMWKSSMRRCLMSWPKIFKNHHFEGSSFLILCNNKLFLNWIVTCD